MKPAAERLAPLLESAAFSDLTMPLVTNVDASIVTSGADARNALARQVASPVRWSDSVLKLIEKDVTRFIEIGPGKVLTGLVREIVRIRETPRGDGAGRGLADRYETLNVEDPKSLNAAIAASGRLEPVSGVSSSA
jgi:[acyl-carrier-protein] S-malonyltransferase